MTTELLSASRRQRLGNRTLLVLLATLVFSLLAATGITTLLVSREMLNHFASEDDIALNLLSKALSPALAAGKQAEIDALLAAALQRETIVELAIYDQNGELLRTVSRQPPPGSDPLRSRRPIAGLQAAAGHLEAVTVDGPRQALVRRLAAALFVCLLPVLASITACSYFFLKRLFIAPLSELNRALAVMGPNDFSPRLDAGRKDEWGLVAHSFNAMAQRLEQTARAGDRLRRDMARQVDERTRELAAKTEKLARSQTALTYLLEDVNDAKQQLEEANHKLQELDRLKSMFIASMSHELRTPLNSIIGFTGIILQGLAGSISDEQRDQLQRVYNASKHLLALITDVIDISKIEAGRIDSYAEEFDFNELVREALANLQTQLRDKGLALRVEVPAALPLFTDRRRLLQCLLNYLGNAIRYTEKGSITLAAELQGENLVLRVRDTGIGIAPEDLERLFQSFVRLDSPLKLKTPGTGLGLYLTKKIATEILSGTVTATSEPGVGSTFGLRVPARLPARKEKEQP